MAELDLSDPLVRAMADRNHQPEETWLLIGTLRGVDCETCKHSWPCPTRQALDALCTCPKVDVSEPSEVPAGITRYVKGLDERCPQHRTASDPRP